MINGHYFQRSAYEVLSQISSLERVPFVPVGLTDLGTLTPQKMLELEVLVSQLSKVWQVIEEPDFPWVGYRSGTYTLEIRSEVLTALEKINQTLRELQMETEDFSAKLGVFPPETFAKINWLLEVSKLLLESPKPESYWLTNPSLDKLLDEAKAYLETSIWIKNTRISLNERYNPSLFNLPLNRSAEIKQQLEVVGEKLPAVNLQDTDLLSKQEKFLTFIRNTELCPRKWREHSQALASLLGLDGEGLTIKQIKELSRMAQLCFAEDKPEAKWFDADYFVQVQETVEKAKRLYQDHNLLKRRLYETYSDGIYDLDLDDLITKYNGPYQSGLKMFNPTFRNDQKQIAKLTNDGKIPKTILQDLIDAKKVKKLRDQIENEAEVVRTLMGHFYHKYRTDFQGAEKAIELTSEIRKLSWATTIPENLLKIITSSTSPSPMIKNLGLELSESVDRWEQQKKDIEVFLPATMPKSESSITTTRLPLVEEWANEVEQQLNALGVLTKDTLATSKKEPPKLQGAFRGP